MITSRIKQAKRVYIIGNGGSFANAEHIANDLLSVGIKAYTLNAAFLTARANDIGYEFVFSSWLRTVGEEGDLLIALSGSGKSPNILKAVECAEVIGMDVVRVFGNELRQNMQEAEQYQLEWGHRLWKSLLNT